MKGSKSVFVSVCGEMGMLMLTLSAMREISIMFCYLYPVLFVLVLITSDFFPHLAFLYSAVIINTDLKLNKMALFRLIPLVYFILEWKKFTYVNVLYPVCKYLRTNNKQDHGDLEKWL